MPLKSILPILYNTTNPLIALYPLWFPIGFSVGNIFLLFSRPKRLLTSSESREEDFFIQPSDRSRSHGYHIGHAFQKPFGNMASFSLLGDGRGLFQQNTLTKRPANLRIVRRVFSLPVSFARSRGLLIEKLLGKPWCFPFPVRYLWRESSETVKFSRSREVPVEDNSVSNGVSAPLK